MKLVYSVIQELRKERNKCPLERKLFCKEDMMQHIKYHSHQISNSDEWETKITFSEKICLDYYLKHIIETINNFFLLEGG